MSPSQGGLQVALTHLLTDAAMRAALRDRPAEVRHRYRLTAEELRLLAELDRARLELTAHAGEAKRIDFLRRGMPMTIGTIERAHRSGTLFEYVRANWTAGGPVLTSRVVGECRQFLIYLDVADLDGLPAWINDMARFELAAAELMASVEASTDGERDRPDTAPGDRVVLGRHVRLLSFTHDIVALRAGEASGGTGPVVAMPTHLALVKRRARPPLQAYRIGELVAQILRDCVSPRHVDAVSAALPGQEEQVAATVRTALSAGLLLAATPAATTTPAATLSRAATATPAATGT